MIRDYAVLCKSKLLLCINHYDMTTPGCASVKLYCIDMIALGKLIKRKLLTLLKNVVKQCIPLFHDLN